MSRLLLKRWFYLVVAFLASSVLMSASCDPDPIPEPDQDENLDYEQDSDSEQVNPGENTVSVRVTTGVEHTVGVFLAELSGRVQGVSNEVEAGIIYGASPQLSYVADKKESTTSIGQFKVNLKALKPETKYYYCAYALVNGNCYLGSTQSFVTQKFSSYVIDGKSYKMVKVAGEGVTPFYIMQTELPIQKALKVGDVAIEAMDSNEDDILIKAEFRTFLGALREKTGLDWRLSKYEEWVYAAQGGQNSEGYEYSGSNSIEDVAWYKNNSGLSPHALATKAPNELGLYDMSGNFAEICFNPGKDDFNIDGRIYGGSCIDNPSACKIGSYVEGSTEGKIPGSKLHELNGTAGKTNAVRLVYTGNLL